MATVLLSAAGSAVGGAVGGSVLGVSAASIGQAAGAIAGAAVDQALLGSGSAAVETGRARNLRIQGSTEGAAVPQNFGRMRLSGQIVWASRYREDISTSTQGGKGVGGAGGQEVREFTYSISLAVGLCEGPIDRIGRIWADGKLLDRSGLTIRVYRGDDSQMPDPKIEAVEGAENVPAYRGLAYVVFEELPVGPFGNRIPQLNFEVFRPANATLTGVEAGRPVPELVRGVALSPGTGEFALDPQPARVVFPAGGGRYANINSASGEPDVIHALDQLDGDLPNCETVSMVLSWFGTDLRCGHCRVEPRIEEAGRAYAPEPWRVAGLTTQTATPVSRDAEDRPSFGGTPSDGSVIRAIRELNTRGKKVVIYPFLLMDIQAGNGLPDPYGGAEQPVIPWRGRITLDAAPDQPGTTDKTPAAATEVASFFGAARASDFIIGTDAVAYAGPLEWTWRRFVLHMAALAAAAGGVEAFCIGSELRGLTTIRSGADTYPAVDQLIDLAAEVRAILPGAKISYAADWSEYFGHQPQDGSGDALFHLDPLWADQNIDFVGIDDYTPLSDWRHTTNHLDADAGSIYSLPYLRSQVEGGEHYDYFYGSEADRVSQIRQPITDGAHDEPWLFRPKDIRNWWANPHHNRLGGVRQSTPTAWVAQSKPVWLTETGCPAVDLGANKPNLFFDGRSSESALPPSSRGARDDEMQRRFLQAKLGYWQDPANNPVSTVYAGPMIPDAGVLVWTWDARPWPDFPVRESLWSDGPAHRLGHWITGRVTSGALSAVVAELCRRSGLKDEDFDVERLFGVVDGYLIERTSTAREALQPLMQVYGFDAYESGGKIVFASRGLVNPAALDTQTMLPGDGEDRAPVLRETPRDTAPADAMRLSYVQSENDYRVGSVESRLPGGTRLRVSETSVNIGLPGSRAQQISDRWLAESRRGLDAAVFALPPSGMACEPGDVVQLQGAGGPETYRIDRITDAGARAIEATRIDPGLYVPTPARERRIEPEVSVVPGPIEAVLLDLPLAEGDGTDHQPRIAARAEPWPGEAAVFRSADVDGFSLIGRIVRPAAMGVTLEPLPPGAPDRWHRAAIEVLLPAGRAAAASRLAVLNGANVIAIEFAPERWELMQFRDAELIGTDTYRLGMFLRGQRGTSVESQAEIAAGARIVLVDAALERLPLEMTERGLERTYRVGPARFGVAHPSYEQSVFAAEGLGLRPFAPAHLRARRDKTSGDLAIRWIRQTRIGGDSWQGEDVPLGEELERYRLRIRAGGTLVRQVSLDTAFYAYSAAEQAADGATGPLEVAVAQLSTAFGHGPERVITVDG